MECLDIDFVGPVPDGCYVLVIFDTFTRWVELFHTVDAIASSAANERYSTLPYLCSMLPLCCGRLYALS